MGQWKSEHNSLGKEYIIDITSDFLLEPKGHPSISSRVGPIISCSQHSPISHTSHPPLINEIVLFGIVNLELSYDITPEWHSFFFGMNVIISFFGFIIFGVN
jgi:hypothetical protein